MLMGYVSSKVRNEYRSNAGAVGGSWNVWVALHSSECWVRRRYCLAGITKLGEQVAKNTKLE